MKMKKAKWLGAVLAALIVAGIAFAGTASQYGGAVSRSDLFRKFFIWGNFSAATFLSPTTTLELVGESQIYIPVDGVPNATPALLIGSTPISQGLGLTSGAINFYSANSSNVRADFFWNGGSILIDNYINGATLNLATTVSSNVTLVDTIASGSDAFSVATNGARTHFGAGSGDYASSDGTTVTFNGPVTIGAGGGNLNANGTVISTNGNSTDFQMAGSNGAFKVGTSTLFQNTVPTISSGFGTGPSIVASSGTAAFEVNVGTGGTASAGVIGLPAATTGWVCNCQDITTPSTNVTRMTANGTTSCTVTNSAFGTGLATAWSASDKLWCIAFAL